MGGVNMESLDDECEFLEVDPTAQNNQFDMEASTWVYRRCQELRVQLLVLTRFAVYAAGMPAFIFDELATIGHPVAYRLRENQIKSTTDVWRRCNLPEGHEARLGLPGRCNRAWFAKLVCGGADLSSIAADAPIWPYVTTVAIYDPLCLLATISDTLERFFDVEIKNVRGVEHMVVGIESRDSVRDVPVLRSFLMDAFRYALSASVDHAKSMVSQASPGAEKPFSSKTRYGQ